MWYAIDDGNRINERCTGNMQGRVQRKIGRCKAGDREAGDLELGLWKSG